MLNEPASSRDDRPVARIAHVPLSREEMFHDELRQMVASVLTIEKEAFLPAEQTEYTVVGGAGSRLAATFEGTLQRDAETAYNDLDKLLAPTNHLALFREARPDADNPPNPAIQHVVHVVTGRMNPQPRSWWPNLLLFIATLLSLLLVGTELALQEIAADNVFQAQRLAQNMLPELWRGLPYAASMLLILGAHELGHYFAARHHRLAVTLPYFIPLPFVSMFGTMGAFIQLREPMKNRKMLLDVGAAGPLTGLIFAIPILFIGLANARLDFISGLGIYEGDSLLYALAKTLTFGRFVPDGRVDVIITSSQLAWAGWTGLLVTALNLIPIGQLDGGHILYALIGERARRLYYPLLALMVGLVFIADTWFLWVILLLFFGRVYATPLDMITPLDKHRRWVAILSLVVFAFIFVPAPLSQTLSPAAPPPTGPRDSASMLPYLGPVALLLWTRLRR